ncbi:GntR family transcriptional regulator [uncultured Anaerococcus sp.]|uniref:GntR family transcriptional regulator n=1 Tax=uncultured Anaerococcus sp. TaxID=293428 RepID=UPI00261D2B7E|nr:GntR family transcriptional regulator [uncultured Anaerococcus sp.]
MKLKDKVYVYLEDEIINNNLKSGDPIVETNIANILNISRTPVREALNELESDGLVVSYPGKGTFVRKITTKDIEDIYNVRTQLELLALNLSFEDLDINVMRNFKNKYLKLENKFSWEDARKLDYEFHDYIVSTSNNPTLSEILDKLNNQIKRYRTIASKESDRSNKTLIEHNRIIDSIISNNKESSLINLEKHLESVKDSAIEVSLKNNL